MRIDPPAAIPVSVPALISSCAFFDIFVSSSIAVVNLHRSDGAFVLALARCILVSLAGGLAAYLPSRIPRLVDHLFLATITPFFVSFFALATVHSSIQAPLEGFFVFLLVFSLAYSRYAIGVYILSFKASPFYLKRAHDSLDRALVICGAWLILFQIADVLLMALLYLSFTASTFAAILGMSFMPLFGLESTRFDPWVFFVQYFSIPLLGVIMAVLGMTRIHARNRWLDHVRSGENIGWLISPASRDGSFDARGLLPLLHDDERWRLDAVVSRRSPDERPESCEGAAPKPFALVRSTESIVVPQSEYLGGFYDSE